MAPKAEEIQSRSFGSSEGDSGLQVNNMKPVS